jgi:hypothetical protein
MVIQYVSHYCYSYFSSLSVNVVGQWKKQGVRNVETLWVEEIITLPQVLERHLIFVLRDTPS